jgi:hypothetical protein
MHRLDREDLGVPGRPLVLLGLRLLLILSVQVVLRVPGRLLILLGLRLLLILSVRVVLRLLAALEVQLGPAGLVDQNKMQVQGSAGRPQDTWLSLALPRLCLRGIGTTKKFGQSGRLVFTTE